MVFPAWVRFRSFGPWFAVAALVTVAACTLLNPLDDYTNGDRVDASVANDGSVAKQDATASSDGGSCVLSTTPERPTSASGTGPSFTFAFDSIFIESKDGGGIGYDLDQQCTCQGGEPSCVNPKATTATTCDRTGGVDNAGNALLLGLIRQIGDSVGISADPADVIRRGRATVLVQLSEWNGTPNDDSVVLGLVYSFGTDGSQDAGFSFWAPDAATVPPKSDGTDTWTYDPDSVPNGTPRIQDLRAFVRDGVLVGRFSSLTLSIGATRLDLQDAIITAKLLPFEDGGVKMFDGIVQGRNSAEDLLTQLQVFNSPFPPYGQICRDDQIYLLVKEQICTSLDIRRAPGDDNKNLPCDAVSLSFGFVAVPAKLGPAFPPPSRPAPCDSVDAGRWVGRCP